MGKEIRRVPPNWEHPRRRDGNYQPMFDQVYAERAREWLDECKAWDDGTHPTILDDPAVKQRVPFFWDWEGGPPDRAYYRDAWNDEPTWFQVYETVTEGTPVTPPFATEEEIVDYLVNVGTYYDGKKYSREAAAAFVHTGWAPSMILRYDQNGMSAMDGIEASALH